MILGVAQAAMMAAVVFATPLAPGDEASLAHAYADAKLEVDQHSDGFFLDTTPQARDALERRWATGADWASAILNNHPGATAEEVATIALNSDDDLALKPLDADSWLVTMGKTEGSFAGFAILKRTASQYRTAWTSWRDGSQSAKFPVLKAWTVDAARGDCRQEAAEGHAEECGPLYASAAALPPDTSGHARFYVDTGYVQPMGSTIGKQLSIWSWDGATAHALFAESYGFMIDQTVGVRFSGHLLKSREKHDFKTFSGCGSCLGRQVDHIIRVDRDGIRDLGRVSASPELDALDAAFFRLHAGRPVDGLAAPKAARAMEAILGNISEPGDNPSDFSLGMLEGDAIRRTKAGAELCFSADATDSYIFTLEKRGSRYFIAGVRRDPSPANAHCKGFPDTPP